MAVYGKTKIRGLNYLIQKNKEKLFGVKSADKNFKEIRVVLEPKFSLKRKALLAAIKIIDSVKEGFFH